MGKSKSCRWSGNIEIFNGSMARKTPTNFDIPRREIKWKWWKISLDLNLEMGFLKGWWKSGSRVKEDIIFSDQGEWHRKDERRT